MKCPFLESEDCETCGYYDYVPEKKCYNCLHPFLNADDEKQQDWKKIVSYMRECGYEWSYEHMKHDYQTYYLHNLYCAFSLISYDVFSCVSFSFFLYKAVRKKQNWRNLVI